MGPVKFDVYDSSFFLHKVRPETKNFNDGSCIFLLARFEKLKFESKSFRTCQNYFAFRCPNFILRRGLPKKNWWISTDKTY